MARMGKHFIRAAEASRDAHGAMGAIRGSKSSARKKKSAVNQGCASNTYQARLQTLLFMPFVFFVVPPPYRSNSRFSPVQNSPAADFPSGDSHA